MMTARLILSVRVLSTCWLPANLVHHLLFQLWRNFILGGVFLFYLNFRWHQRRKAGPSLPLLKLQRKSHHQPPSFRIWTTLYCSPSGQCLLVPWLYAGLHSQWEQRQRETETEVRRMESMKLHRKDNWDLAATCTSWTTDETRWQR